MFLILPRIHFCSSELMIIVKAPLESAAGIDVTGCCCIIASLTIETISRGTQEMARLTLTVQGCYWLSKIRMTVVESLYDSQKVAMQLPSVYQRNTARRIPL